MAARKSSKSKQATRLHQHQSFGTKTVYVLVGLIGLAIIAMWYISTNGGATQSFLPYPGR